MALLHLGAFSIDEQGRIWREQWFAGPLRVPVNGEPTLAERNNTAGYLIVPFQWDGVGHVVMSHRVVYMEATKSPLPNHWQVNHRDGDKQNNRPENLEAGPAAANVAHSKYVLGNTHGAKGSRHGAAKLTEDTVREIRRLATSRELTQTEIGKRFGVCNAVVSAVVNRKSWCHVE